MNFQMFKLVLEKAEEPEIKLPTSTGSSKKQESSRETSISALLTMPKPLTVWIAMNCGKFWKRWTGHATIDWFQIGKGVHQGCILPPCLFNLYAKFIKRNVGLEEAQGGIKIARKNINNLRYADDTIFGRKWRRTKEPLDESEREEWKSWLKTQHSENKDHGIWSHHFIGNRWQNSGNSVRLYFGGL